MVGCLIAAKAAGLPALVRVADRARRVPIEQFGHGPSCALSNILHTEPGAGGPYRAQFNILGQYVAKANGWTIACPQIETKGALDELDDILNMEGVDMVCFGPNDLSAALTGRFDIHAKEVTEAMTLVLKKCREKKVMSFIFANDLVYATPLIKAGWTLMAIGYDAGWFAAAAAEVLKRLRA